MRAAVMLMLVAVCASTARAQEDGDEAFRLQRFSDALTGGEDADASYEDQGENLLQVLSTRHDLNTVTAEELRMLQVLTDAQVASFLTYRGEQGKIFELYELQVIPGFDRAAITALLPYVSVKDPLRAPGRPLFRRMFSAGNSYFVSRYERTLERKNGFRSSGAEGPAFRGSPDKLYVRLRSSLPGEYSLGFTGEKDAGERLALDPRRGMWGFDFTSWHFQLRNRGKLTNLVVGDFRVQFAQGLLLGGGFGLGKGGENVAAVRKSHVGFLPYTGVNEGSAQKGLAITLQPLEHVRVSAFYSGARRDASPSSDSLTVGSVQESGLHRTEREIANRKRVVERNYGLVVHYSRRALDAGLILNGTRFSMPLNPRPALYNQFAFSGAENMNGGFFLNYRLGNFSFFSEAGQSQSGGKGGIAGLLVTPHAKLDIAVVYRNYDRDFHTFYSNAFSENTAPANERGVYWGWKYRWSRRLQASGHMDLFTFPWLAYRRYAPSAGYEWSLRGSYSPSRTVALYVQVRGETKSANSGGLAPLYRLVPKARRNFTAHCDYGLGEVIRLRSRLQYNRHHSGGQTTTGVAIFQDIMLKWKRFKFSGRHALFDTDHHDNRLYAYEHDAWLAYSLPAYEGVGVRNYALIEYKVHARLTLWMRFARTRMTHGEESGTGPEVIEGNTRNDVKFQARFEF